MSWGEDAAAREGTSGRDSSICQGQAGVKEIVTTRCELATPPHTGTARRKTLKRAGVPYFRIYDLRSTYATRLSAGGVADEWVTQLLRQSDAKVVKKYSQMKLQTKREALEKMNRQANEMPLDSGTATIQ
jgi:integrase